MNAHEKHIVLAQLRRHEDMKLKPYTDTEGNLTIGIGTNLDAGITPDEAVYLCTNRIKASDHELWMNFHWYADLSGDRKYALVNMCFNLGLPRFKSFKKMIAALERDDFRSAAKEALDSKWARQVGHRAIEIAEMIRVG